jgi:hypothetical protein
MVWRVSSGAGDEVSLAAALETAVKSPRVVPTLIDELKKRSIGVERLVI